MMVPTRNENSKTDSNLQSLTPALQESIKNIISKERYTKYDIKIRDFDTRGGNFLGKLYEIDIIGETTDCQRKETNIFVKQRIDITNFKLVSIADSYIKELFIYNDLSKVFKSLQHQANVPQEDRYKIAKAFEETDTNALILENLSKRGFMTYKKMETVSIKYAQLAVQELAKFHALTFVIEHKMPEYYNNKIKVLKSPFYFDEDCEGMIRNTCAHVASLYDDEVKQKIEKFVPIILEKLPKYCNDQTSVRCTLTHGDYKKNNMLVRLVNGEPVEIVPVDYQLADYGCPIKDFLFFIFSTTDRELRKKHLNDLKELYFNTLSRFVKYFDMDVEIVYPREEFEKVYTEWLDFGLMMTLFASIVIFIPDTGVDFENHSLAEIPYCPDKIYDDIIRGLVDDFIEWGYL